MDDIVQLGKIITNLQRSTSRGDSHDGPHRGGEPCKATRAAPWAQQDWRSRRGRALRDTGAWGRRCKLLYRQDRARTVPFDTAEK